MATPETAPADTDATWAESGTVADLGDIGSGWPVGKPGRGRMNAILKWCQQAGRFLLHRGVPDWRAAGSYAVGDRCQGTDGKTYVALLTSSSAAAKNPTSEPTYWALWGHTDAAVNTLVDAKLGTISGALADGTITITMLDGLGSTAPTVTNARQVIFPNSTDKLVVCRITFPPNRAVVLTLSGAAVFVNQMDGIVTQLNGTNGSTVNGNVLNIATVISNTVAHLSSYTWSPDPDDDNLGFDVWIRGH